MERSSDLGIRAPMETGYRSVSSALSECVLRARTRAHFQTRVHMGTGQFGPVSTSVFCYQVIIVLNIILHTITQRHYNLFLENNVYFTNNNYHNK